MDRGLDGTDEGDRVEANDGGHEEVGDEDDLHDDPEHAKGRERGEAEVHRGLELRFQSFRFCSNEVVSDIYK